MEIGVSKPEIDLLRGIGGGSLPENCSEEAPVDGDDDEGDYFQNKGEEGRLISTTASGCVGETKRRIYSRSEMESLRFQDVDAQRRMWSAVYAGPEAIVRRIYSRSEMEALRFQDVGAQRRMRSAVYAGPEAIVSRVGETKRRIYSRSEMEALRFLDVDAQRRMWSAVYTGLEAIVSREYNKFRVPSDQKKGKQEKLLRDIFGGMKDDFGSVGEVFSFMESSIFVSSDVSYGEKMIGSENHTSKEASYCEDNNVGEFEIDDVDDDDNDVEYDSIQRLAFLVEGEPDFDSGPPLDGLEYLRRVRWEAAQIPNVKVARLNLTKIIGEQTPYMPSIPDIAECPSNLLPSKHWEEAFLSDFLKLRQAFSELENSGTTREPRKPPAVCRQKPKGDPTVTAILAMDVASRASILRSSISSLEPASALSRADCLWLFALSATVDAPLAVDTCASMRCLLRKCSSLLAAKSQVDDEVSMLSILISIAGKYFGQSENR